jgi:hypothetical protein
MLMLMLGAIAPLSTFALVRYGQSQGIIFFLIALGVWWAHRGSRSMAPFLFGVASSLKLFTVPLIVVALRYFGMRGALLFSAGFVALWIPFVALCGLDGLAVFFAKTLPYVRSLSLSFDGNISVSGAIVYSLQSFDRSAQEYAPLVQGVCLLLLVGVVGYDYRRSQKEPNLLASVSFVLTLCVMLSPTAWPHYAPLLLGSYVVLVKSAQGDTDPRRTLMKVLGLYLCVACALGYQRSGDIVTQIVSAWWAPAWIGLTAWMVDQRRGGATNP